MKAFTSTLSSTFGLINNCKNAPKLITNVIEHESDGIAFAHIHVKQKEKKKKSNHPLATITCFKCREKGHYLHSCPKEQSDTQMLLDGQEMKTNLNSSPWQYSANNQTQV